MDALTALHTRNSVSLLTDPAPSQAQLDNMFQAALRANDHGLLRPWKYVVIQADRRQAFGELMAQYAIQQKPEMSEEEQQAVVKKAFRAPMIVVAIADLKASPKVPEIEQWLSAGGSAQLFVTAAHAQGVGAMWRTGPVAFSDVMHQGLGLSETQKIIGFIYLGTPIKVKSLSVLDSQDFVVNW